MEVNKFHHPSHIYKDDSIYFITARTYQKEKIFNTDLKRKFCLKIYKTNFAKLITNYMLG